ncbi:MAG: hypothetical protein A2020_13755 [Lentisphaerae bacterium GWF2_45_14]|nr:MAG: hypothetical protein A2020_13755 [Lentisphaerae bacterium GWF2_45_14]
MKIGNAAWGFRETPIEKQLAITQDMGLELLELSIAGYPTNELQLDSTADDILKIKALFNQYGISAECAAAGNDFTMADEEKCRMEVEKLCRVIDIAAATKSKLLRIFAGFSPAAEVKGNRWKTMISCIRETAAYASKYGIALAIETHGGVERVSETECIHFHSVSTELEMFVDLLKEMPVNVGVNFDPANLYAVGIEKPENFFEAVSSRVNYMHLKDFKRNTATGFLTPVACGESEMNWKNLMAAIKDFSGPALIEYENTGDAEDGFRRSLDYLKAVL